MKYSQIGDRDKVAQLDARLRQYEQEHYQHTINLQILEAMPKNQQDEQASKQIKEALATLEHAHKVASKERALYPDEVEEDTPEAEGEEDEVGSKRATRARKGR